MLNNLNEAWLEISMLPFLAVMSIFLGGRMATSSEINRRFLLLVLSTLAAACFEVALELFTDIHHVSGFTKLFYAVININAYSLMAYVAAYTRSSSRRLIDINFFMLSLSIILLFMFKTDEQLYMLFSPGFAVAFDV